MGFVGLNCSKKFWKNANSRFYRGKDFFKNKTPLKHESQKLSSFDDEMGLFTQKGHFFGKRTEIVGGNQKGWKEKENLI